MSNDVVIHVRVRQDARDGFAAVGKEAEAEGHRSGEKFTARFGTVMARMGQLLSEPVRKAGQHVGEQIGEHGGKSFVNRLGQVISASRGKLAEIGKSTGETISREVSSSVSDGVVRGYRDANGRLRDERGRFISGAGSGGIPDRRGGSGGDGGNANVDVDRQSLLSRFLDWGRQSATSFWEGFSNGLSNFFSGDLISMILKGILFAALGAAIAVPLSGAIASAILLALGSGVIAVGVAGALKDPRIKAAAGDLKTQFGELLAEFGKPFRTPVAEFLERLSRDILPTLKTYGPVIAAIFAPLAGDLSDGLIGFIQNLLPGLVDGLKGAEPIIRVLAERLPDLGQMLGDFFREMGEHGPEAAQFFDDLLRVIMKLVDWLGKFIGANLELYVMIRNVFTNGKKLVLDFAATAIDWFERILDAAFIAFSWIPGLGGKLASAKSMFRDARVGINAELDKIKDKTVTIRMRTFGLAAANAAAGVARQLAALGYQSGGIVGQLPQIGTAATGGIRGGLTLVGERGPELANLAPGSRVYSNEDSRRMAAAGTDDTGGQTLTIRWVGSVPPVIRELMAGFQLEIGRSYAGNVQAAMGR